MVQQVEERLLTQEVYKAVGGRMSWEAAGKGQEGCLAIGREEGEEA